MPFMCILNRNVFIHSCKAKKKNIRGYSQGQKKKSLLRNIIFILFGFVNISISLNNYLNHVFNNY